MEQMERSRPYSVELRVERRGDDAPKIIGHAAVFNQIGDGGWFREQIAPGAFADSIAAPDDIRALFNHDPNIVLGRNVSGTLRLSEDATGLAIEIDPPNTQAAKDLMVSMERGDISQMSFGFIALEEEWQYGENKEPDLRTLKKVRLFDVSPVTFPFYEGTDVTVKRSHDAWKAGAVPNRPEAWRKNNRKKRYQRRYAKWT